MNLHINEADLSPKADQPPKKPRKKIAIIGSGISGSASAWLLRNHYDVVLYEKNHIPGGHTATVDIDYDGTPISVDTGFIVYNEGNYPHLTALFDHLNIQTHESNMSFSFSLDKGKFEWGGQKWRMVFGQKSNIFKPHFWLMLREVLRFNALCLKDRDAGHMDDKSIGDYLDWRGFSSVFQDHYLIPIAAAIWSSSAQQMREFSARHFVNFFENHRLIHRQGQFWRTVTGGSRNYLNRLHQDLEGKVRLGCGVCSVQRVEGKCVLLDDTGQREVYDHVIFACHTDQALEILNKPTDSETHILSAIPYSANKVYLHRDPSLMPKRKSVWAAWNYLSASDDQTDASVAVSYWMNRLQAIDRSKPIFVTLNPTKRPDPALTFGEYSYDHPQFSQKSVKAHQILQGIQGHHNTWFAGAWTGNGFHEDGLLSAVNIVNALGVKAPWQESQATKSEPIELLAAQ